LTQKKLSPVIISGLCGIVQRVLRTEPDPNFYAMCYTLFMTEGRQFWQTWVDLLSRWGLSNAAAVILETAGPLNIVGAQVVYLAQPLFTPGLGRGASDALARVLEDAAERQAFIHLLRETAHLEPGA